MATLEKIRNKAGLLVIVIGLALLAFLFGDFLNGCSSVQRDNELTAFSVNGNDVKIYDYEERVRTLQDLQQMMMGSNRTLDEVQSHQLRNQAYINMVAEQILTEEAEKVGIVVTPAETFDLIQGEHISPVILQNPMFVNPETGQFDKAGLLGFLKQIKEDNAALTPEQQAQVQQLRSWWLYTEKAVRDQRLSEKYTHLVTSALVANPLEVAYEMAANATAADVAYVAQKPLSNPDVQVEVTDADLKKYYNEHKEYFRSTEDAMQVDIVYANIRPSDEDRATAKQDMELAREELIEGNDAALVLSEYSDVPMVDAFLELEDFSGQYFPADLLPFLSQADAGVVSPVFEQPQHFAVAKLVATKRAPKSAKVRHIVLAPEGSFAGQVNADSLLAVVKAMPTTFAEQAMQHSMDQNTSTKGGEIGTLSEFELTRYIDADFANAVLTAQVGVPFGYTSKYGEHIILVEELGEVVNKYKVAYAVKEVVPSTATETKLYNELSEFLSKHRDADLMAEALNAGYQTLDNVLVGASQPFLTHGITNSRTLVHWGMSQKAGAVSDITEAGDKYVIVKVNQIVPAGYMPLELVKEQVTPVVEQEKKLEAMYATLEGANYTSLQAYADAVGEPVDTLNYVQFSSARLANIGQEPKVNAVAAFAPEGTLQPLKGNQAVYLASVLKREPVAEPKTEADVVLMLNSARRGYVRAQALQSVISKAEVKDTRYKFQ